jgi:uncharacterized membrane protein YraQ (UPF0718 family)
MCGLLIPLVLMEERFGVRAFLLIGVLIAVVIGMWVKSIKLARWIRRYEQQVTSMSEQRASRDKDQEKVSG